MGILGYLIYILIIPVFRFYSRTGTSSGMRQKLQSMISRMEDDIEASSTQGLNHQADGQEWGLALVSRTWPLLDSSQAWSKDAVLYHYDQANHKLQRGLLSPKDSSGNPVLTGGEPSPLKVLSLSNTAQYESTLPFITSEPWTDVQKPLTLKMTPPDSDPITLTKSFAHILEKP